MRCTHTLTRTVAFLFWGKFVPPLFPPTRTSTPLQPLCWAPSGKSGTAWSLGTDGLSGSAGFFEVGTSSVSTLLAVVRFAGRGRADNVFREAALPSFCAHLEVFVLCGLLLNLWGFGLTWSSNNFNNSPRVSLPFNGIRYNFNVSCKCWWLSSSGCIRLIFVTLCIFVASRFISSLPLWSWDAFVFVSPLIITFRTALADILLIARGAAHAQ